MQLDAYQIDGVDWLAARSGRGLADDPGLGKSAQSIHAAAKVGARRIGIACPPTGRTNWRRQFKKWWPLAEQPVLDIEGYQRIVNGALAGEYDVLLLDEAHYLKNPASQRTRAIYGARCAGAGLIERAEYVWPLSGTIAPNGSPMELYPHIRALHPDLITVGGKPMTQQMFMNEFCVVRNTPYGPRVVAVKNGDELRSISRQIFLRRTEQQVAQYLPEIIWENESVDSEEALRVLTVLEDRPEVLALRRQLEESNDFHAYEESSIATLRRVIGELKAPAVASVIAEELRSRPGKVVIFAQHHSVINILHTAMNEFGVVSLTGQTPERRRVEHIDSFQGEGGPRVFIGQLDACREMIELTAANRVEFVESSWTPRYNYQAAKRVQRRGQIGTVFARVWGLAGSIDDLIADVCARKVRNLSQIEV